MRTWGLIFIGVAIAGVLLPGPLGWWLLAVVAAAGVLALCGKYSDARARRTVADALDTDEHVAHLDAVKALPPAIWEESFDERTRLRSVAVPGAVVSSVAADDSWLEDLVRPDSWCAPWVPAQRQPSTTS